MTDRDVLHTVLADLTAEGDELARLVEPLTAHGWSTPTPAHGWTVAHQVAHLAWTDAMALLAVQQPTRFAEAVEAGQQVADSYVDEAAAAGASQPPEQLLAAWQRGRTELSDALLGQPAGAKIGWFGPPMSPASMATARLMETWAHGQDVADALGVRRGPTSRIKHIAHLGVRTRDFSFLLHGLRPPAEPFLIELTAPDGRLWSWGDPEAAQQVTGPAVDFCLLAVQRIHRDDTALVAHGSDAEQWLRIAQAFAGPPGAGRPAGAPVGAPAADPVDDPAGHPADYRATQAGR